MVVKNETPGISRVFAQRLQISNLSGMRFPHFSGKNIC